MSRSSSIAIDVHLDQRAWEASLAEACLDGLLASPKTLSPVWFYDETGSKLFDEITRLPEYYPTRSEATLLQAHAAEMVERSGADVLVELGSGTSDKTEFILDALEDAGRLRRYVPFDVSRETLQAAADRLVLQYPGLDVHGVVGDFHQHLGEIPRGGERLVAFLGGTIGNLAPEVRHPFLAEIRRHMSPHDHLLLGVDLVKDTDTLVRAYDDADGTTAAFNRNALSHLNDRFGADFVPDRFEHVALWDDEQEWIEMRLRATEPHVVDLGILGARIEFAEGEELRTEISAKFTPERIAAELDRSGFAVEQTWRADPGFLLVLARPLS